MTLDQLIILDKIVEEGSIRAAAKVLYRTQPTLSVSMKKLEDELELEIFSRGHHHTTLTPTGKAIYQKAKRILDRVEEFEGFGKLLAKGNEPEVNIALDAGIPVRFIAEILKKCETDFPGTNLNLSAENLSGTVERLREGAADLAVIPYFERNPFFESLPLIKFRFFPVAASTYPPAQYEVEVPLDDMRDYVQVILTDSARNAPSENYNVIEGARHWRVNSYQTRKEIILEGLGWGGLPDFTIQKELETGQVVPLKIENYYRVYEGEICVVRKAGKIIGPVAQRLWELFQSFSEKEGALTQASNS